MNISKTFPIIALSLVMVTNGLAPAKANWFTRGADKVGDGVRRGADKVGDGVRDGARAVLVNPKETVYRTHPYYLQTVLALKIAKKQGVIRTRSECNSVADKGSTVAGGAAVSSGVGVVMSGLVKTVGKDAGHLACKDVF